MFNRRHPYLFFILAFTSMVCATSVGIALLIFIGVKSSGIRNLIPAGGEKVGIVEVDGFIADSGPVVRQLKALRDDDAVKAIVIRINSPGGGVAPSQEIYAEARKVAAAKPVIASMGTVAASGGYYIAAATDGIVANPGTLTGSIGVIMGFTNFQELLDKIGLVPVVVKSGEYKDLGSPARPMTQEEKRILQEFVDHIHRQFVAAVSEGRKMETSRVADLADGRIFSGQQAKDLGLIDRLGNLEDAVEWAGRQGGIQGKIETVTIEEKDRSLLELLMESVLGRFLGKIGSPIPYPAYLWKG